MKTGARVAIILAGAVAKGAFEAGALSVLVERNVRIVRIVGASSGALNATLMASGICTGSAKDAAKKLVELWQDRAGVTAVFDFSPRELLQRRGISDQKRLLSLMRANIKPHRLPHPEPVGLRIVAADLNGVTRTLASQPATTYERVFKFDESDFAEQDRLDAVFRAAAASSAFPLAFAPCDVMGGGGPCVDGGVVNNSPIKYALEDGGVDAVVVISPTTRKYEPEPSLRGIDLGGHIADMLINERLYRDLKEAEEVNEALRKLEKLSLDAGSLRKVKEALGWTKRKTIQVVTIRPARQLPGNSFEGFWRTGLRAQYVELGREAAQEGLKGLWPAAVAAGAAASPPQPS
jgi:NTE family protein